MAAIPLLLIGLPVIFVAGVMLGEQAYYAFFLVSVSGGLLSEVAGTTAAFATWLLATLALLVATHRLTYPAVVSRVERARLPK